MAAGNYVIQLELSLDDFSQQRSQADQNRLVFKEMVR